MNKDPFSIFSLERAFNIELMSLRDKYLELQKKYHPDNFINQSTEQQHQSILYTSYINDAYNILKNPISRAEAIVNLEIGEQNIERISKNDVNFLTYQLLMRQNLENISQTKDFVALIKLSDEVQDLWNKHLVILENKIYEKSWLEVLDNIDKLKFIDKIIKQIAELEAGIN